MDGNRRYGKAKYNSVFQGHKDGADTLVDFMGWCIEFNIKTLTVYAFSTENWNRNEKEVSMLMGLITTYIDDVKKEAHEKYVRIRCISSDFERLPEEVRKCVLEAEAETAAHQRFTLNICLSYGGRHDLVTAARTLARRAASAGDLDPEHIDEAQLRRALATRAFAADPDLVLRTSGERRLSNFLPLEAAYAELVFLDALWPEVTRSDLAAALHEYGDGDGAMADDVAAPCEEQWCGQGGIWGKWEAVVELLLVVGALLPLLLPLLGISRVLYLYYCYYY
eukprot:CAMPEP_0206366996 /NCGR_PEP_ID=MMETSP0294-20121207/3784_1 /ASSEMBLY_ACC=CAM_ASM_000327 /TAXON_ID=39354 /ORGANISM="Heterosigma akashiwo, Strain CCMP2393" /LENGTH=279 /DNA_ID=CAMNT_0053813167 /DNA_START=257 /DNA_END=1097 /DNA_ORIENTATION=-